MKKRKFMGMFKMLRITKYYAVINISIIIDNVETNDWTKILNCKQLKVLKKVYKKAIQSILHKKKES